MTFTADRETNETTVHVDLERAEPGQAPRGVDVRLEWDAHGGLDEAIEPAGAEHLYETLISYARLDGTLEATGDLAHHVIEDAAIALGAALAPATNQPIRRFADRTVPMDESLVHTVIDLGGRPHHSSNLDEVSELADHVARTFAHNATATLHVRVLREGSCHHVVEAAAKATGLAVRDALQPSASIQSTKGHVDWSDPGDVA